jgi:CheY-like chemotaxis protein
VSHSAEASAQLILIVEDDALIAMEIETQVQALGYAVLGSARSVDAANELLNRHHPHAALLDVNLNGTTVTPIALRLRQLKVPYALVTGYPRLALEDPVLADAPRLRKPVVEIELAQMLKGLLQGFDQII